LKGEPRTLTQDNFSTNPEKNTKDERPKCSDFKTNNERSLIKRVHCRNMVKHGNDRERFWNLKNTHRFCLIDF
jgi:hypothetical protein